MKGEMAGMGRREGKMEERAGEEGWKICEKDERWVGEKIIRSGK